MDQVVEKESKSMKVAGVLFVVGTVSFFFFRWWAETLYTNCVPTHNCGSEIFVGLASLVVSLPLILISLVIGAIDVIGKKRKMNKKESSAQIHAK